MRLLFSRTIMFIVGYLLCLNISFADTQNLLPNPLPFYSNAQLAQILSKHHLTVEEFAQLLEELAPNFIEGPNDLHNEYENITPSQLGCLLITVYNELVAANLFSDIIVPSTYSGDISFKLTILPSYKFKFHYDYNEATQKLVIDIVVKPSAVPASEIWKYIDSGMEQCVN